MNTLHTLTETTERVRFIYKKLKKDNSWEESEREIEIGSQFIIPLLRGGEGWGKSHANHRFVKRIPTDEFSSDREYLQGVETDDTGQKHIKRFYAEQIMNLQVIK